MPSHDGASVLALDVLRAPKVEEQHVVPDKNGKLVKKMGEEGRSPGCSTRIRAAYLVAVACECMGDVRFLPLLHIIFIVTMVQWHE